MSEGSHMEAHEALRAAAPAARRRRPSALTLRRRIFPILLSAGLLVPSFVQAEDGFSFRLPWSAPAASVAASSPAPAEPSRKPSRARTGASLKAKPASIKTVAALSSAAVAADPVVTGSVKPMSSDNGAALDPAWPKSLYVVTDSVFLGAKQNFIKSLADWQVTFTGRESLTVSTALGELPKGPVGTVAVVALGYNSSWQKDRQNFAQWADLFDRHLEAMLAALKARGARKVVWVLLRELPTDGAPPAADGKPYSGYGWYFAYVNERLRAAKERHPELALADWTGVSRQTGLTFDAIHLNPRGADLMVSTVRAAIGLPPTVATASVGEAPPPIKGAIDAAALTALVQSATASAGAVSAKEALIPEKAAATEAFAMAGTLSWPTYAFRDCLTCPEMVVLPAATFTMGSPPDEPDREESEGPARPVTVGRPFAVGRFEITFAEWDACVAGGGCQATGAPRDEGPDRDRQPVTHVSWDDAVAYTTWLSHATGKSYRLLTESEWEYAARAQSAAPFPTGAALAATQANYQTPFSSDGSTREGEYRERPIAVGAFLPNAFGLHDMSGNVAEWVADNWHDDYRGAPGDGRLWNGGDESQRTVRGGSWYSLASQVRSASRRGDQTDHRSGDTGFRIARAL